jgi:predicted TIM-barrel fold metal-dependent hydrolase
MHQLKKFARDDYFKIDVECHIAPNIFKQMGYYLQYKMENFAYGVPRFLGEERLGLPARPSILERDSSPESIISWMDKYGVDMSLVSREDVRFASGGVVPTCTNEYILSACERYPGRLIFAANPTPILTRDMNHVLGEREYLVKEKKCKAVGEFGVDEEAYINDRKYWPFYAKVSELGIPIIIHTGMNLVRGVGSKYHHPQLLEDIAREFPRLQIIALHAGWPYHHDLNLIASSYANIHVSLSFFCPWCISAPKRAAEMIGEALLFVGSDRIVWGSDVLGAENQLRLSVQGFSEFEISEELQMDYGFPPLSSEDKRKIFGLNLAKLLGVKPERKIQ